MAAIFYTVKDFIKTFDFPKSEGALRWYIVNRHINGLDEAIIKIGGRILIDADKFFDVFERKYKPTGKYIPKRNRKKSNKLKH